MPHPFKPPAHEAQTAWRMPEVMGEPSCVWDACARLGEGAHWSVREQALYWVDILGWRLHRWTPARGSQDSWCFDEEISAVTERQAAAGLLMSMRHGLALWHPQEPGLEPAPPPQSRCVLEHDQPLNRCNDGRCDARGRFWVGTIDAACTETTGALYCVSAQRQHHMLDVVMHVRSHQPQMTVINGPTWTQDQRTMLLNDTTEGLIWAYDFDVDTGALSHRRVWLQFSPDDGLPDGMCTDAAGRIWIAHWGGGCVSCHAPHTGSELGRITLPVQRVTSCAFGGADLRTLFITTAREGLTPEAVAAQPQAGGLFAVRLSEPGCAPHLFAG